MPELNHAHMKIQIQDLSDDGRVRHCYKPNPAPTAASFPGYHKIAYCLLVNLVYFGGKNIHDKMNGCSEKSDHFTTKPQILSGDHKLFVLCHWIFYTIGFKHYF